MSLPLHALTELSSPPVNSAPIVSGEVSKPQFTEMRQNSILFGIIDGVTFIIVLRGGREESGKTAFFSV